MIEVKSKVELTDTLVVIQRTSWFTDDCVIPGWGLGGPNQPLDHRTLIAGSGVPYTPPSDVRDLQSA